MMCKFVKGTKYYMVLIGVGFALLVFGITSASLLREAGSNISRVMGIFTGLGASFVGVGTIRLIHQRRTAPEKLREEEIELKDERNVQLIRVAYTISSIAATLMFAGLVILFSSIGSVLESYICLGALLLQQVIFVIARRYYSKKM